MDSQDISSFEDPSLKAALRRGFCGECAPADLRRRIRQAIGDSGESAMRFAPSPATWGAIGPSLAIAASMLIAIGSIALLLSSSSPALPRSLELAAVTRHDTCCQHPDHHGPGVPQDSFPRIGQYLRQELNHPVLAADLQRDGWTFRGAAICPVGEANVKSAHLIFQKGNRALSIFSLPAAPYSYLIDHKTYEDVIENHPVIARREGGAVYCLVAQCPDGGMSAADLKQILAAHESEATVAAVPGPRITVAGILREP